jgi:hypothetical protein
MLVDKEVDFFVNCLRPSYTRTSGRAKSSLQECSSDKYSQRAPLTSRPALSIKAKIREIIQHGGATPAKELIKKINTALGGWVEYFRVGNSSRAFSEVRDYLEMKVRTLLTLRKRRQKRSVGWRRWSNEYLYGVLGLFWDWIIHPLQNVEAYS